MYETVYDTIIIGGGPAGLTAALYCSRAGLRTMLFEGEGYGGQIAASPRVENYPGYKVISGNDLISHLYDQAMEFGTETEYAQVEAIRKENAFFVVTADGTEYVAKTVILATGVKNRRLGLANEEDLLGCGISYCATCDGAFFKDLDVAVAGGGSTALTDAIFLAKYCRKVYLIHRRSEFRGEIRLVKILSELPNVEFVLDSTVEELVGDTALKAVVVKNKNDGQLTRIDVSGLFVAIGQIANNEKFKDLIALDESGYIIAGEDCRTSVSGIFAAGDCRQKSIRQLTTATSDGTIAAVNACEFIGSSI